MASISDRNRRLRLRQMDNDLIEEILTDQIADVMTLGLGTLLEIINESVEMTDKEKSKVLFTITKTSLEAACLLTESLLSPLKPEGLNDDHNRGSKEKDTFQSQTGRKRPFT